MRAELVRIIGGPTGTQFGQPGPTGPAALQFVRGAAGLLGPTGKPGLTGPVGLPGLFSGLMGLTGTSGPPGSTGYPGPLGWQGRNFLVPDDSYFFYGTNPDGFQGIYPISCAIGCKFRYTVKGGPNGVGSSLFVYFTGQFTDYTGDGAQLAVSIVHGREPAPNPGDPYYYPNFGNDINYNYIQLPASGPPPPPRPTIPFFCSYTPRFYGTDVGLDNNFPQDLWFDLGASYMSNVPGNHNGGQITNIQAIIFEVPL